MTHYCGWCQKPFEPSEKELDKIRQKKLPISEEQRLIAILYNYCPNHRDEKNRKPARTIEQQDASRAKSFEKTLDPVPDERPRDSITVLEPKPLKESPPDSFLSKTPAKCRFCGMEILGRHRNQTLHTACKLTIQTKRASVHQMREEIISDAGKLSLKAAEEYFRTLPRDVVPFKEVSVTSRCPRCDHELSIEEGGKMFKWCPRCRLFYAWVRLRGKVRTSIDRSARARGQEFQSLWTAGGRGREVYDLGGVGSRPESNTFVPNQVLTDVKWCDICKTDRDFMLFHDGNTLQRNYWGCLWCGTAYQRPSVYLKPSTTRAIREFGKQLATMNPLTLWEVSAGGAFTPQSSFP